LSGMDMQSEWFMAAAAVGAAKREAELRALYVVVPPGDEAMPVSYLSK